MTISMPPNQHSQLIYYERDNQINLQNFFSRFYLRNLTCYIKCFIILIISIVSAKVKLIIWPFVPFLLTWVWQLAVWQHNYSKICIQLNFVKANFIKTNTSLRRSKSLVPNRVLLILTKIQLFKSKYLCRTIYVSKHILRSQSGVLFVTVNCRI